ncbi:hypothetical protein CAPN001_11500 [Capnocytophaga stomatis]|uniref:hypothetical protein n=1 Tax=Capnocytophaga stomatis TaxID=1848904 RepID=UPI00194FB10B|nr:hypothetical protein [Capnocytophaga stomatis]GIJ96581.1 hypothetical protein CAPN001_11500 [Capnocytophaga stomatis]
MKNEQILKNFEKASIQLVEAFAEKQELDFEGFVGDDPAGVACFSWSYFFNISDIYHDLKTNQPKDLIIEWHDESAERTSQDDNPKWINYQSWTMGKRYEDKDKEPNNKEL